MQFVRPMMALPAREVPEGDDWTYEVKWDGYRAQALKRGANVTLASRNLKDSTRQFPSIAADVAGIAARDALLDGEIVALDPHGRPSFQALHHWATAGFRIVYYAFDLLAVDGASLLARPLAERRAALARVVAGSGVLLSEPLPGTPAAIERAVRRLRLEGVVAKRSGSRYEPGKRSGAWVKVKFSARQEFVIGGYKPGGGTFDSLLVGYYEAPESTRGSRTRAPRLMFAGKVRNGFTPALRARLFAALTPLASTRCPFANLPSSRTSHWGEGITADEMTVLKWVRPKLVAEIAFTEWTADNHLRHSAFVALRDDKKSIEVYREIAER